MVEAKSLRGDLAGEGDVVGELGGLPGENVRALIDEALILNKPGEPTAGMILGVGHVDRAVTIRNGMRGIADVGVE